MTSIDWIIHEPAEDYHEQSRQGNYMSSHMLADFRKSPALYRKKVLGLVSEPHNASFIFGTLAHKLILEGNDAFFAEYVVSDGPINPRTGEAYGRTTKAYAEWEASQEGSVVDTGTWGEILNLATSVRSHAEVVPLLAKGCAEGVVRAEYCGVPCQIRMDWFNPELGLVDLKTCAEIGFFEYDFRRWGYIYQLAFYRAVIRQATGENVPVKVIAVEKSEPIAAGVWAVSSDWLDYAEKVNEAALAKYKQCCETGIWPTGYEQLRVIDMN